MDVLIKTVKYLSDMGLTHRDFSSNNILFNMMTREIKVIDFGMCMMLDNSTGSMIGTINFVSKKIKKTIKKKNAIAWGVRWDLYSIGNLLNWLS